MRQTVPKARTVRGYRGRGDLWANAALERFFGVPLWRLAAEFVSEGGDSQMGIANQDERTPV